MSITRIGLAAIVLSCSIASTTSATKRLLVLDTSAQLGGVVVLEGQVAIYDPDTGTYAIDATFSVPGDPPVNAIHKLPDPGEYLFSVRDPQSPLDPLGVVIGQTVGWSDVIRSDGAGGYSRFFCSAELGDDAIPPSSGMDAAYLDGDQETGDLIISLDAPVDLDGVNYEQNDLLRYGRTGPGCGDWDLLGHEFDASGRIPAGVNVVGASRDGNQIVLALDVPASLAPSTYNPYEPLNGDLATWDVDIQSFSLTESLAAFPTNPFSQPDALAAPPQRCVDLQSNVTDSIVDVCGASWTTDDGVRRYRMEWPRVFGATHYTVYRGARADLTQAGLFMCVASDISADEFYVESTLPVPGEGFFYLVQADGGPLECNDVPGCGEECCPRVLVPQGACP